MMVFLCNGEMVLTMKEIIFQGLSPHLRRIIIAYLCRWPALEVE